MINTTKDIFWLIAGLSVGALTFFICWAIYYFVMMLRDARKIVTSIKHKIDLVDTILRIVKEKLERTSGHLAVITETV